eukprot:7833446-Ditylum_brightwellii.AAC.1
MSLLEEPQKHNTKSYLFYDGNKNTLIEAFTIPNSIDEFFQLEDEEVSYDVNGSLQESERVGKMVISEMMLSNKSSAIESITMFLINGKNATDCKEHIAAIISGVIIRHKAASNNGILQQGQSQGTVTMEILESMISG